jgi:hypothetical protein
MPSMVNANRFINTVAIPLVIVAYGVFLFIDHNNQVSASYNNHIPRVQKIGRIDGLLFGGSNAVYGLSAEFLSYHTGMKWYNASVNGELGTIERHKNFIQGLSAGIDRTKVRYVVYSSIAPYRMGEIALAESRENLGIKPKIPLLGYILHQPSFRHSEFPKRNSFGDMVFEKGDCDFTAEYVVKHEREDEDISVEFLADYAIFLASLFPNASILIVLPSEYYGTLTFDDSIFKQTLNTKFHGVLGAKYSKHSIMKIMFQPPYSSITQTCNRQFHANEDGRLWQTRNLIEFLREAAVR